MAVGSIPFWDDRTSGHTLVEAIVEEMCTGMETCSNGMQREMRGKVIAFMDDTNVMVPPCKAHAIAERILAYMAANNIPMALGKCSIVSTVGVGEHHTEDGSDNLKVVDGFVCMGTPTGTVEYREQKSAELMVEMLKHVQLMVKKLDPKSAYTLLQRCVNLKPSYLSRVSEKRYVHELLGDFDGAIDNALASIINEVLTEQVEEENIAWLRSLPLHLGGLGFIRHSTLHGAKACLLSRRLTLEYIQEHVSMLDMPTPWEEIQLGHCVIVRDMGENYVGVENLWDEDTGGTALDYRAHLFRLVRTTQERSSTNFYDRLILSDNGSSRAAAFMSSQFKGSGKFLKGNGGGDPRFCLEGDEFIAALRSRLLLPMFGDRVLCGSHCKCVCKLVYNMNEVPFHCLDCPRKTTWVKARHDAVRDRLVRFFTVCEPDAVLTIEPQLTNVQRRGDIRMAEGARNIIIDVTIRNQSSQSNIAKGSHLKPDVASGLSEKLKRDFYSDIEGMVVDPLSADCNFIPFAIETTGRLGVAARNLLATYEELGSLEKAEVRSLTDSIDSIVSYYNARMTVRLGRDSVQQI